MINKIIVICSIVAVAFVCFVHAHSIGYSSSESKGGAAKAQQLIGKAKAIEIALTHAGVKRSDVRDLDCELDRENGVLVYDIDFEVGDMEYDYDIDAKTGAVLSSWKERD